VGVSDAGTDVDTGPLGADAHAADVADGGGLDVVGLDVTPVSLEAGVCPAVVAPSPLCGAALCGNGKIDTCDVSFGMCGGQGGGGGPPDFDAGGDDGGCAIIQSESCDGHDFGGKSCKSLGFSGGTLACNAGCGYDVSGCDHCGTGAMIASCGNANVKATGASALALAASGANLGLAWVTGTAGKGGLHVAVLASDLSVVAEADCLGVSDVGAVAIAATPSGWLVAAETPSGIELIPLTATGAMSGAVQVLPGATSPILAGNPSGGPLLVWVTSGSSDQGNVSLLGADGTVMSTTAAFTQVVEPQYGSAVYVGDGFLVALRASLGATVIHVGLDGSLGTPHSLGDETEYPKVAWTGSEGRVVYADFSAQGKLELQRLDATGALIGSPTKVGGVPAYYDPAPVATSGSDSVVLLPGYTGGTGIASHLDVTRVAQGGTQVYAPYVLAKAGSVDALSAYVMVPTGQGAVVAWLAGEAAWGSGTTYPSYIGIARVTP
jgi:hypothetical protein